MATEAIVAAQAKSTASRPSRVTALVLVLLAIVLWSVFLYWIPASLHMPLARDQGIFAWVGSVIVHGGLPYANAWEVKGPAVHFMYATALLLFGEREVAVRIFDLCMWVLAACGFVLLSRGLAGKILPGLLSAPLLLYFSHADFWNSAQPDLWASILLLCSLACALGLRRRALGYVVAGLLVGIATLIKPFYVLFLLVLVLSVRSDRSTSAARAILMLAGAAVTPLLVILFIYAGAHQLSALFDVMIRFNAGVHVTNEHPFSLAKSLAEFAKLTFVSPAGDARLLLQLFALIGWVDLYKRRRDLAGMLGAAVVIGAVFVFVQNKFYYYHFTPYWVFVAALAGIGIAAIVSYPQAGGSRVIAKWGLTTSGVAWVLFVVMSGIVVQAEPYWRLRSGEISEAEYLSGYCGGDYCYGQLSDAATFVRAHTRADDRIYVWGFDALLYFLAERQAPSRFGNTYPLVQDTPEHRLAEREELMRDLCKNPPAMFLVQTHDGNNLTPRAGAEKLRDFPALQEFLYRRYRLQMRNPHVAVYAIDRSVPATTGCTTRSGG